MTDQENYNNMKKHLNDIENEIIELNKDDIIQRYNRLNTEKSLLEEDLDNLYRDMKRREYDRCHHLLITTYLEPSRVSEENDVRYCGCLKCGLDEKERHSSNLFTDYNKLPLEKKVMVDYLKNNHIERKSIANITCDLELARAIYKKILEYNPKINDKLAIKYLEIALDNIRNIKMTEDRKESRIKRLELKSDFINWKKEDVTRKF